MMKPEQTRGEKRRIRKRNKEMKTVWRRHVWRLADAGYDVVLARQHLVVKMLSDLAETLWSSSWYYMLHIQRCDSDFNG
ncbi:hypothetical protein ISN44_As10g004110 [Arabidopsis suecica]|uniref:Uncharacterized protein n=1 Tax=Arabidopsis suecica TaxID=45249 RepID=A0A8T1ZTK9_ARASU|nr:hypothetical protein ISN44_As10g004110 [Arabidopsis suecica]